MLGLVLGLALIGNMLVAGIVGAAIPLSLRALRLDPALASSVLVTTVTDSVGFALFLGLAWVFLPYLS
jgi:magnesium transporter